jgi:hypothetical protein
VYGRKATGNDSPIKLMGTDGFRNYRSTVLGTHVFALHGAGNLGKLIQFSSQLSEINLQRIVVVFAMTDKNTDFLHYLISA